MRDDSSLLKLHEFFSTVVFGKTKDRSGIPNWEEMGCKLFPPDVCKFAPNKHHRPISELTLRTLS